MINIIKNKNFSKISSDGAVCNVLKKLIKLALGRGFDSRRLHQSSLAIAINPLRTFVPHSFRFFAGQENPEEFILGPTGKFLTDKLKK